MPPVHATPPELTPRQKNRLRRLAHHRRPVVILGAAGVSEAVLKAIEQALADHELIKIKLPPSDRAQRRSTAAEICTATASSLVQQLGRTLTIYRPSERQRIEL